MSGMDLFRFELGSVNDSGKVQTVSGKGLPGEEFKDHHRIGFHGFAYNPPAGSHALALAMHGRRDRAVILGLEHADKRQSNVPAGGAVLYDAQGNVIRMFNNKVEHDYGSNPATIKAKSLTIEFEGGTLTLDASGIKHNGRNIGDTHVHGEVTPGSADTGVPSN